MIESCTRLFLILTSVFHHHHQRHKLTAVTLNAEVRSLMMSQDVLRVCDAYRSCRWPCRTAQTLGLEWSSRPGSAAPENRVKTRWQTRPGGTDPLPVGAAAPHLSWPHCRTDSIKQSLTVSSHTLTLSVVNRVEMYEARVRLGSVVLSEPTRNLHVENFCPVSAPSDARSLVSYIKQSFCHAVGPVTCLSGRQTGWKRSRLQGSCHRPGFRQHSSSLDWNHGRSNEMKTAKGN